MTVFRDFLPRFLTSLVLVSICAIALWLDGPWFTLMVAVIAGAMIWELCILLGTSQNQSLILGGLATLSLSASLVFPLWSVLPVLLTVPFAGLTIMTRHRRLFSGFSAAILLAAFGLIFHLTTYGLVWMIWLVAVVAASDIAGYMVGRLIGGRKFWPSLSPNKTWAGTLAGWAAAALVGFGVMVNLGIGSEIIGISIALAMIAQLADIAESAVKRKAGVKDSSNLLPGHGGLFDRFDAMVGAAMLLFLIEATMNFPPSGSY